MNKQLKPEEPANDQGKSTERFPQFTRLFSASTVKRVVGSVVGLGLWLLLLMFLVTNIASTSPALLGKKMEPFTNYIHSAVARVSNVLGAADIKETNVPPEDVEGKYAYWEKIVLEHPDYRDGHFILATLAYQLSEFNLSRQHLEIVRALDPNFSGIPTLEALLPKEK